jgi:Domain of unknown function (DUF4214)
VAGLYAAIMGREPTDDELGPYAEHLRSGGSTYDIVVQMLESPECQLGFFRNPVFRKLVAPEPMADDTPRLYVWHIPKTAGTSLREMLMPHFSPLEFCGSLTLSELYRLSPARLRSFRVIAGHFGPMLPPLLADVPLVSVTMLRDPIDTVASLYCHWRDHGIAGYEYTELARQLSFDDWCRRDELQFQWANPQAKSMALQRSVPAWPGPMGSPEGHTPDIDEPELRVLATSVMAGIDIVGTPDDLVPVYLTCLHRLGIAAGVPTELRVNVSRGLTQPPSSSTREWLMAHNQIDAELFEHAHARRDELELTARV